MEIEAKFSLLNPTKEDLDRLKAIYIQAGYGIEVDPDPIDIVDVYYDRTDHALRRAGAAFRIRKEDREVLLTFKRKLSQEGALHTRVELESPPTQNHVERVNAEMESTRLGFRHRPRSAERSAADSGRSTSERRTPHEFR